MVPLMEQGPSRSNESSSSAYDGVVLQSATHPAIQDVVQDAVPDTNHEVAFEEQPSPCFTASFLPNVSGDVFFAHTY